MRRSMLIGVLPVWLSALSIAIAAPTWTNDAQVSTVAGRLLGHDDDGSWVWKGIPYAKPPTGKLRWRAPQPPLPWHGTRDAAKFADRCPQFVFTDGKTGGSEDCLYLNIWRPKTQDVHLPVYVWIHGGGNSVGDASTDAYRGREFALRHQAVFVSIQYRLGVFGWFAHPALRTGNPDDDSGNFGTLDIIQSLRWLHDNVAAFGGDPGNVTIAGESAGAFDVVTLLLAPPAQGLFQKAVAQSGRSPEFSLKDGERVARNVTLQLMVNDGSAADVDAVTKRAAAMRPSEMATYLRSKSFADFYAVVGRGAAGFGMDTLPEVFLDGHVIVADGVAAFATDGYPNRVPLMIGTNRDEARLFLVSRRGLVAKPAAYLATARYFSQQWKLNGADGIARAIRSRGDAPPVFVYEFLWGNNAGGEPVVDPKAAYLLGASHSLDVDFFLDHPDGTLRKLLVGPMLGSPIDTPANRPGRVALTDAIQNYLDAFMRTGNPNRAADTLPQWQPWSNAVGGPKSLLLDAKRQTIDIRMSARETTAASIDAELDVVPSALAKEIRADKLY